MSFNVFAKIERWLNNDRSLVVEKISRISVYHIYQIEKYRKILIFLYIKIFGIVTVCSFKIFGIYQNTKTSIYFVKKICLSIFDIPQFFCEMIYLNFSITSIHGSCSVYQNFV